MKTATTELLILDVDGVLTDGCVNVAVDGELTAAFCVQDGLAIQLWQRSGGKVAILSGRPGQAVVRRAERLGIEWVRTGVDDKVAGYDELLTLAGLDDGAVAYLGDDLPDLGPLRRCGFPMAVANALPEVKRASAYVTRRRGGEGAVAEVVELLLRRQRKWSRSLMASF